MSGRKIVGQKVMEIGNLLMGGALLAGIAHEWVEHYWLRICFVIGLICFLWGGTLILTGDEDV